MQFWVNKLSHADILEPISAALPNKLLQELLRLEATLGWNAFLQLGIPEAASEGTLLTLVSTSKIMSKLLDLSPQAALLGLPLDALLARTERELRPPIPAHMEGRATELRHLSEAIQLKRQHQQHRARSAETISLEEQAARNAARNAGRNGRAVASTDEDLTALPSFRTIPVLPERADVLPESAASAPRHTDDTDDIPVPIAHYDALPVLPRNRARGSFPSVDAYLGVHFRLLREDCIAELRKAMQAARSGRDPRAVGAHVRRYNAVRVVNYRINNRGVSWTVRFETPFRRGRGGQNQNAAEYWRGVKRLMTGSLLTLVPEKDVATHELDWGTVVFATVSNRDEKQLAHHQGPFIDIQITRPEAPEPAAEAVNGDDEDGVEDLADLIRGFALGGRPHAAAARAQPAAAAAAVFDVTRTYAMFESTAYFEAFRPVLEAMQMIPDDPTRLPFSEILLGRTRDVGPPTYLTIPPPRATPPTAVRVQVQPQQRAQQRVQAVQWRRGHLDMTKAFPKFRESVGSDTLDVLQQPWPEFQHTLNESQMEAVQLALTHSLSIIVGPPGCGKTVSSADELLLA